MGKAKYKHCIIKGCRRGEALCSRFKKHVQKHHRGEGGWIDCESLQNTRYNKCPSSSICREVTDRQTHLETKEPPTLKRTFSEASKSNPNLTTKVQKYARVASIEKQASDTYWKRAYEQAVARAEAAEEALDSILMMQQEKTETSLARLQTSLDLEIDPELDTRQRYELLAKAAEQSIASIQSGAGAPLSFIDCKEDVWERIGKFVDVKEKFHTETQKILKVIEDRMELFGAKPTNQQSAIAFSTALTCIIPTQNAEKRIHDQRHRKMLVEVPSAGGKSRIAIQLILTLLHECRASELKVVVVYPTEALKVQDAEQFEQVQKLIEPRPDSTDYKQVRLLRFGSLHQAKEELDEATILVIDEVDYVLMDQQQDLENALTVRDLKFGCLVGLTATVPFMDNRLVIDFFNRLGFHRMLTRSEQLTSVVLDIPKKVTWAEFWQKREHNNLIIFTDEEEIDQVIGEIDQNGNYPELHVNTENKEIYRNMNNTCLLVSKENLMRGIDYRVAKGKDQLRATEDGIDLLIAAPMSNHRMLHQARGRVGRCGESCGRYILSHVAEVDESKEKSLAKSITALMQRL